ncbi:MAG: molybdenum cofactor guanylyltransferase [Ignavibacteria bacterium]|nr:molybdenum cofactor guanylyltransferase [Ignavibacteria bacterium]
MKKDITGIILCGGKRLRMQTNKALLKLDDKTIIEIILAEMKKVFEDVIISANDCEDFSFLNIPIIKDIQVNLGPLGGIHSALKESKTDKNFITTCDLPLINRKMIEHISIIDSEKEIVIPAINGMPQRLFGVYNKSLIKKIEQIFELSKTDKNIKGSIYELHQRASVELVEVSHLPLYKENMFMNMNTPEEYELIKNIYENQ